MLFRVAGRNLKLKDDTPEMPLWARLLLGPDEAGVETSGHCRIGGAFNNRPAVRKQRQLIGVAPELEYKVIMADRPMRAQAFAYLGQVQRAATFMDLDGVAATQCNVGP